MFLDFDGALGWFKCQSCQLAFRVTIDKNVHVCKCITYMRHSTTRYANRTDNQITCIRCQDGQVVECARLKDVQAFRT